MYKAPVVASQSVSTFDSPFVDGQLRGSPSQAHYHSKWRRTAELFFELGWRCKLTHLSDGYLAISSDFGGRAPCRYRLLIACSHSYVVQQEGRRG